MKIRKAKICFERGNKKLKMKPKYTIYLIPELKDRNKISNLRSKMCKLCHTTQSLQYPVHISLASGTIIKDYSKFEKNSKSFVKNKNHLLF